MTPIQCFPPIADNHSRILILGTMPGSASLVATQYYAHPRNAFWQIMGDLVNATRELPYESRRDILKSRGVALWDVLASCARRGSLDSAIKKESITPNDLVSFFNRHPAITNVFFNGAMAEKFFRRRTLPLLGHPYLTYKQLPSTSPAHASLSYQQKCDAWKVIVPLLSECRPDERFTV